MNTAEDRRRTKEEFLRQLMDARGNVRRASERANVQRRLLYLWRDEDPEFDSAWGLVLDATADDIESELTRRAYEERGMPGVIAALALLKRYRPEQYQERHQINMSHDIGPKLLAAFRVGGLRPELGAVPLLVEGETAEDA